MGNSAEPVPMPCMVVHPAATPPALSAGFESKGHITGPQNAPVTIIVFADFQCGSCAFVESSLKQIRQGHPQDVREVFINSPLSMRDKDALAMQAAEAADLQGKYWEMHDLLFEKQADWMKLEPAAFKTWVTGQAATLGLDETKFQADMDGTTVQERVQQAVQSSGSQSLNPPVLFVNSSSPYTGLIDYPSLEQVVSMEILSARQYSLCPNWVIDPAKQYIATLHTSKGDVVIQLLADKAPMAVNNFVFLAKAGWYDHITFYRVTNQVAETGDPSETGMGNPGYLFNTELPAGLGFDKPGMLAMENSGYNTNGSRFLVTLAPATQMNGTYTIFGKVISGLDVLQSLTRRDPTPGEALPAGDELTSVTIEER